MKKVMLTAVAAFAAIALPGSASAATYVENFNAAFPAWQSAWFGANSNAANCYVADGNATSYRGNNSNGLWVSSTGQGCNTGTVTVTFNAGFASSLTSFALDISAYVNETLRFFDANGSTLSSTAVAINTNLAAGTRYSITSTTGIGGFSFSNGAAGNTSIDNLTAVTRDAVAGVPEPATWAMMLLGFGAMGFAMRRRQKTVARIRFA